MNQRSSLNLGKLSKTNKYLKRKLKHAYTLLSWIEKTAFNRLSLQSR